MNKYDVQNELEKTGWIQVGKDNEYIHPYMNLPSLFVSNKYVAKVRSRYYYEDFATVNELLSEVVR